MVCVRCGKNYLQGITAQLVWKPNIVVGNCGLWIAQMVVVVSRFDMQSNYMDTTYTDSELQKLKGGLRVG